MNMKLSAVSDKHMELTCSACGHEFSYKIADLILATSDDTTTHEVRQRAVAEAVVLGAITPIRCCSWAGTGICVSLSATPSVPARLYV